MKDKNPEDYELVKNQWSERPTYYLVKRKLLLPSAPIPVGDFNVSGLEMRIAAKMFDEKDTFKSFLDSTGYTESDLRTKAKMEAPKTLMGLPVVEVDMSDEEKGFYDKSLGVPHKVVGDPAYVNPITVETHSTLEDYVESLAEELSQLERATKQLQKDKATLTEAVEQLVKDRNDTTVLCTGKRTLEGTTRKIILETRETAKYNKPRGAEHPLAALLPQHPILADMIRVTVAESGSKIDKLMSKFMISEGGGIAHSDVGLTDDEFKLCAELIAIRKKEPASSVIQVRALADKNEDKEDE